MNGVDPAAARDAMAASDAAVDAAFLDECAAAEIWAWLADGNDPWRHALPFTGQTAIKVDAAVNNSDS